MAERRRWTAQMKAALVEEVAFGRLDRAETLLAHEISEEEFAAWERCFQAKGLPALRAGAAVPQAIPALLEEPSPWRSAAAPASLRELSDWFSSQAELCHRLSATYGREARLLYDGGDRRRAIDRMDFSHSVAAQARSYEHAARLSADFSGSPG